MRKNIRNYDNRTFVSIDKTANGEVSSKTTFRYKQEGKIISATYSGGECVPTPEIMVNGRIRLFEKWKWRYKKLPYFNNGCDR